MSLAGTQDELRSVLQELERLRDGIQGSRTNDAATNAKVAFDKYTKEIQKKLPAINADMSRHFRESYYQAGGTSPIPKPYYQKAYRARQKALSGMTKSTDSLRIWSTDFTFNRKVRNDKTPLEAALKKTTNPKIIKGLEEEIASFPDYRQADYEPSVRYFRKTKGGLRKVDMPFEKYSTMASNAAYSIQRNLGVVGAAAKGSGYVIVQDGPHCGKRGHNSGDPVNGQIWKVDDAFADPLSHPYCQRTFHISAGPPGSKKTKAQLQALGLAPAQRREQLKTLKAIAQVAAGTGVAMSVGAAVLQNPFIHRFIREIMADPAIRLNPIAQQVLNRIASYAKNEEAAFQLYGPATGIKTQAEFSKSVADSFDTSLGTPQFLAKGGDEMIKISVAQARVLNLPINISKQALLERLDDYADYLVHKTAIEQSIEERLQSAVNFSHGLDEMNRTAALKFQMNPGEGINARRNWYNVVQKLKTTYEKDPAKAERDLIKLAATVFDPTPWLKVNLPADMKFTIGMTSRGRQDLAAKLFDKFHGGRFITDQERSWAENLGMDLGDLNKTVTIGKKDIVNAFQPRLSYQPGGMFSATIALKNGKLQPIIRLYPPGTFGRYVSLESKLRAGAIEDFIKVLRDGDLPLAERWVSALSNVAQEDLLTTINLFRNSPISLALHMTGPYPDAFAIRALPDNDFLQYSYRFTLDYGKRTALQNEIRRRLANGETLQEILDNVEKASKREVNRQAAKMARGALDDWQEGIILLPNFKMGFTINGMSMGQREAIVKLKLLGNNLLTIAKRTHYGYDQVLEIWQDLKLTVDDFLKTVSESDLRKIRNWNDVTTLLGDTLRKKKSVVDTIIGADLEKVDISYASQAAQEASPALRRDLARFRLVWEKAFPNIPLPLVKIMTVSDDVMSAGKGVIYIRDDVAKDWALMGQLRRRAVRVGHFTPGSEDPLASLIHEGVHTVVSRFSQNRLNRLVESAIDSQGWPLVKGGIKKPIQTDWLQVWLNDERIQRRLGRTVSNYATRSPDEWMAEALTEALTSNNPRAQAQAVMTRFLEMTNVPLRDVGFLKVRSYDWETKSLREIKKIYTVKYTAWIKQIAADEKVLEDAAAVAGYPHVPDRVPEWVHLKNPPKGLEGLILDKELLNHPEFISELEAAALKFNKVFPNLKLPQFAYHPTQTGTLYQQFNYAMMHTRFSDKYIYMPEGSLGQYWEQQQEIAALAGRIGWFTPGTRKWQDIIVHEMGHDIILRMNNEQFFETIDWFIRSDVIGTNVKRNLSNSMSTLRHLVPDPTTNTAEGILGRKQYTVLQTQLWIMRDKIAKAATSSYGTSSLHEFFAEFFADGMRKLLAGGSGPSVEYVKFLQGLMG